MTPILKAARKDERGNALFLILIAVALFAALSYAVTQSGRGSGNTDKETGLINSAQLTQFPAAVRTAVTRMVLTGTSVTAVDYKSTSSSAGTAVFGAAGGGVIAQPPPSSAMTGVAGVDGTHPGAVWRYKAVNPTAANAFYVKGIGASTGPESFAFIGVNLSTCRSINHGLGLASDTPTDEAAAFVTTADANEGDPALMSNALGGANDTVNGATIGKGSTNQAFACVENVNPNAIYIYYHTMIEQ